MSIRRRSKFVFVLAALAAPLACKDSGDDEGTGTEDPTGTTAGATGDPPPTSSATEPTPTDDGGSSDDTGDAAVRPNWHEDIAPLTAQHCRSCHNAGGVAPFDMATYEMTRPWAPAMALDVDMALMPPWHAVETDECAPPFAFKHDARLDDAEKQLFRDWADLGAPEGDPALAAPLPDPPSLDLQDPSTTELMQSEVTIPAAGQVRDYFNCLSIDPGNTETVYVDGLQVIPGNTGVVHHVLIYVDPTGESAAWPGGVKTDCNGGAGIQGQPQLIAGWVPGSLPIEPPTDVGTELPPGTRLILNVHYHAQASEQKDSKTGLAIRWKSEEPAWTSRFVLVGAPGLGMSQTGEMLIPAGASGHEESFTWSVNFPDIVDVRVWAALAHMHKVGVDLKVWVESGDTGDETCLLQTPKYDYNWQRSYAYDTPVTEGFRVRGGDKVHVRCTFDNTLMNPGVQEMLAEVGLDAPIDVGLGEGTLDEMCLSGLGVAIKGGL
jgi:hypothetical protein